MTVGGRGEQQRRPLWTCPDCGKQFVTPRMWHSCSRGSVEAFFAGCPAVLRQTFDAYVAAAAANGPVRLDVAKTRISIQAGVRFAGLVRVRRRDVLLGFWLKPRIDSPRFAKVELLARRDWIYHFAAASPDEIDDEVRGWLAAAYQVGIQASDR